VDEFEASSRAFAERVANGPTRAHAATKRLIWEQKENGARAADGIVAEVSGPLFDTADLQNAVKSFLADGPGKATYEGR
jgi:enoyl-CoA hydratase/carnithine racemase